MIVIGVTGVSLAGSKRCVRRKVLPWRSRSPGGAGVNSSEGQPVWLCWDLEPAADVLLWMLPAGKGAAQGGNHR